MRNFALARILTKDQIETLTSYRTKDIEEALLYLELRHTPSLSYPTPILSENFGVAIKGYSTIIPLQERHLKALMNDMYTCRFTVKNGRASAYRLDKKKFILQVPLFQKFQMGRTNFIMVKQIKCSGRHPKAFTNRSSII